MKKVFFSLVVLVFLGGCGGGKVILVQAPSAPRPTTNPELSEKEKKQIQEKIQKAERTNAIFYGSQDEWKSKLGLWCPNPNDYDRVIVSHWASHQRTSLPYASVTVFSEWETAADIYEKGRLGLPVIQNFCPGGSITLQRGLQTNEGGFNVSWTARSSNRFYSQSGSYSVQRPYNNSWYSGQELAKTGEWCLGTCRRR